MQDTHDTLSSAKLLELDKQLSTKIYNVIPKIETIGKDKKGYNFNYADGLEIRKEVNTHIQTSHILIEAPDWVVNPHTFQAATIEKEGKNFLINGVIQLTLRDTETGHALIKRYPGIQTGTDPMQAKGSAETYAMRQFIKETFAVEVEKSEIDVSTKVYVTDKEGTPSLALDTEKVNKIVQLIIGKTGTPQTLKEDVAQLVHTYNSKNKTNYEKLAKFPETEFEEMIKYASAFEKE